MKFLGIEFKNPFAKHDAEVSPSDTGRDVPEPEESEHDVVQFVLTQFRAAAARRAGLEKDWVLSVAFEESRQWLGWDDATNRTIRLMDTDNPERYVTDNQIAPLMTKWVALVTTSKPDATPAPESDSDINRAAATEARAILAHLDRKNARNNTQTTVASWAAKCPVYRKRVWNPKAMAAVPSYDAAGNVVGKRLLPVGDVEDTIVPGFEVYLDPEARDWDACRFLIHACKKPLSYFKERYGNKGGLVEGDAKDATAGSYVDSYATPSQGLGGASAAPAESGWGNRANKAAVCYEYWEKPSPRFLAGRLIVVAGKRVLYNGAFPYRWRKGNDLGFPFIRYVYAEASGHPYGKFLVPGLVPLQMAYNRLLTRLLNRIEEDKPTLVAVKGAVTEADAFSDDDVDIVEGRVVRRVYVNNGFAAPQWMSPPPVNAAAFQLLDKFKADMMDIAGIHEVSQGQLPASGSSGVTVELLLQSDRTQMGLFITQLEQNAADEGELALSLYAQFASPDLPRMMGLDDSGNPQTAGARAMAFRALTGGGAVKVLVQPGSAIPKSSAGKAAAVYELYDRGLLGPVGDPRTSKTAVRMLSLAKSDEVLERLDAAIAEQEQAAQAMEEQARVAAQAQAVGGAAQEQERQAGAVQAAQVRGAAALELEQTRAQNRLVEKAVDTDAQTKSKLIDVLMRDNMQKVGGKNGG